MQNPFGNLPLPTFQANTQRMHQGVGAEFPHGGAGPSMLVPGFAPAGASMPHAMDGLFPELMANAASQGRATPPGGAGAIFFNPLAHVPPAAESPPAAGAAKKTYISGRKIVNNVVTRISTPYSTGHIPCPYGCGRSFKHATQKAIHVRKAHTGERPFECKHPGCGKTFFSSGDLKSHEKTHSGVKAHQCETCGKALSSRNALRVHIRALHTLERPFKCEEPGCGVTYMTRADLDRHLNKHAKAAERTRKLKMSELEKRAARAEKQLGNLRDKVAKGGGGGGEGRRGRVADPDAVAGVLVPVVPGVPVPEGAIAYVLPADRNVSLNDLVVVSRRKNARRASLGSAAARKTQGGSGGGSGGSGSASGPAEPTESLTISRLFRDGGDGDGDPTVQGGGHARRALAEAVEGGEGEGGEGEGGKKRKRAVADPTTASGRRRLVEAKMRAAYEEGGLKGTVPFQSWRRGLTAEATERLKKEALEEAAAAAGADRERNGGGGGGSGADEEAPWDETRVQM